MPLTLRETKGLPLTHVEMDNNILTSLLFPIFSNELSSFLNVEPMLDYFLMNVVSEQLLTSGSNFVSFATSDKVLLKLPANCTSVAFSVADITDFIFVNGFPLPYYVSYQSDILDGVSTFIFDVDTVGVRLELLSSSANDLEIVCNTVS